jgi:transposase
VKVEAVPWATGKHTLTTAYMQFLALWARRLAWSEVARIFHTSWEKVFHSVEWMVQWGLEHRRLTRIRSLGIDEVAWRKGHEYLTLVYQIDGHCQRLLWVGKDRTVKSLLRFFRWFGKVRSARLRFICSFRLFPA